MVASRDGAAWSALARAAAELPAVGLDRALASRERLLMEQSRPKPRPMALVVGAPRSGTTLVYQALVAALPVSYLSNWSALFHRAPISASRMIGCRDQVARTDFHSYYGQTRGLQGVNDGYHVWDRWFGHNRFEIDRAPGVAEQAAMRQFFDAWSFAMDAPLVNKNNRNSLHLPVLAEVLPEATFVVVRRDAFFVVQSLLGARQVVQGSTARGWGLLSRDSEPGDAFAAVDAVCAQVIEAEAALTAGVAAIPPARVITFPYDRFVGDPASLAEAVSERLFPGEHPEVAPLVPFEHSDRLTLEPAIAERVRQRLRSAAG